jgi:cytidylate kinase
VARAADIRLSREQGCLQVFLDGGDVTSEIRLPEVTENIHYIARPAEVRDVLVELQRRLGREMGSFVAEGRDQGSVVFPHADYKFYLDASPKVRAERRYRELLAAGQKADHREIFKAILQRDQHDMGRQVAPLVRPTGAIEIDTSLLTIPRVVEEMLGYLEGRR